MKCLITQRGRWTSDLSDDTEADNGKTDVGSCWERFQTEKPKHCYSVGVLLLFLTLMWISTGYEIVHSLFLHLLSLLFKLCSIMATMTNIRSKTFWNPFLFEFEVSAVATIKLVWPSYIKSLNQCFRIFKWGHMESCITLKLKAYSTPWLP